MRTCRPTTGITRVWIASKSHASLEQRLGLSQHSLFGLSWCLKLITPNRHRSGSLMNKPIMTLLAELGWNRFVNFVWQVIEISVGLQWRKVVFPGNQADKSYEMFAFAHRNDADVWDTRASVTQQAFAFGVRQPRVGLVLENWFRPLVRLGGSI